MKNRFKITIASFSLILTLSFIIFAGFAVQNIKVGTSGSVDYTYSAEDHIVASIEVSAQTNDAGLLPNLAALNQSFVEKSNVELLGTEDNEPVTKELPKLGFTDSAQIDNTISVTFTVTNKHTAGSNLLLTWDAMELDYSDVEGNSRVSVLVSGTALEDKTDAITLAPGATQDITLVFTMKVIERSSIFELNNFQINLAHEYAV